MLYVETVVSARNEDFDGLANELVATVAKKNLSLCVDNTYLSLCVDDDHAIGRRLQQVPDVGYPIGMLALEPGRKLP